MARVFNFSAGPAMMPEEVLRTAQSEMLDYHGKGLSVMEMSHRSKEYMEIAEQAEQDLRDLYNIPDNYKVLFLQGGGRGQFADVPMNLIRDQNNSADYIVTGAWSKYAYEEGLKYGKMRKIDGVKTVDGLTCWNDDYTISPDAQYVYYCMNETIHGIEHPELPKGAEGKDIVVDISSDVLTRKLDISKFGVVFAGAQKNIGPAGLIIVIVREDLLGRSLSITPSVLDYKVQADKDSMYNTPPTYSWYIAGLVFKWMKEQGGVAEMERRCIERSTILYDYIDSSDFYISKVAKECRSRVNVPFVLKDDALNAEFLAEAKENGLINLKGHRVLGGMRASIYNAMPVEGVKALVAFMDKFAAKHR
ncbi:MAG: 3-phosphoserine/phosphohydroxythreonine transaminase [Succinivibrionaceae bacterium]|nr:3-phosphoserine/phosphohydroxythreonine transaminase [Succinivibrionaceae bacterium]